jgi:site-specific DNA-methyltransferase (adenine-specific)
MIGYVEHLAEGVTLYLGDCRQVLPDLSGDLANCCATSPPYWRKRNYGSLLQIGQEGSPKEFIAEMVGIFSQVRRILRDDGTLWLNLGDSRDRSNLLGLPWRVALALQDDGWILRQDIIWHKLRPMPDGAKNRPSMAHEYLFLFSKSENYYYDSDAAREAVSPNSHGGKKHNPGRKALETGNHSGGSLGLVRADGTRNIRSVWSISGTPFPGAHGAPFPIELVEPCIRIGCPLGGVVIDPFSGSGTTGVAAVKQGCGFFGIDIDQSSIDLARSRILGALPFPAFALSRQPQPSSSEEGR